MAKTAQGIVLEDGGLYDKILYVSKTQLEMFSEKLKSDAKAAVAKEDVIKLLEPEEPDAILVPCDIGGAGKSFPATPEVEEILAKLSPADAVQDIIKSRAHFEETKKNFKKEECPIEVTVGELAAALEAAEGDLPMEGEGGEEEGGEEEEPENSEEEDGDDDEAGGEPAAKKAKTA